jgi:lysophospholipase L1-like esterase
MQHFVKSTGLIALLLSLHAGVLAQESEKPRLVLIGDSTVKNGQGRGDGGLWGWGQVIGNHFDLTRIDIENQAIGGRSSRTFLTEGRWDKALERLRPGDFLIMQFGHNDGGERFKGDRPRASLKGNGDETEVGVVEMTGKEETVHSYGWYLRKYIADAKAKGATVIVCSLIPRDRWKDGKVIRSNKDYGKWAREAAEQCGALFIDLNEIVARRYEEIGAKTIDEIYFTEKDWTHTTKVGAVETAKCLVKAIRELKDCKLAEYLRAEKVGLKNRDQFRFAFDGTNDKRFLKLSSEAFYSPEIGYGFEPRAKLQDGSDGLSSDKPFYFSAKLPEGNYHVQATYAASKDPRPICIKAELRRLMVHNRLPSTTGPTVCDFTVNIRRPEYPGGSVRLKPREKTDEIWAWDDRLTLEFTGNAPLLTSLEIVPEPNAVTVFLAGDSTVADQPREPWNSWGQMLPVFFKPAVAVANHAQSGESIRGSLGANRFDKIFSLIKPGDYLFVQFGHNDMKNKSSDALENYRANLVEIVEKTREIGAQPVLVTSMERKEGRKKPTLMGYPQTVRDVAEGLDVPLVDLNVKSLQLYRALGDNFDKAFQDGTHHTNYGSYLFAKAVVQSIRDLKLPLADMIVDDFTSFDPNHPDSYESVSIPASPHFDLTQPAGN